MPFANYEREIVRALSELQAELDKYDQEDTAPWRKLLRATATAELLKSMYSRLNNEVVPHLDLAIDSYTAQ